MSKENKPKKESLIEKYGLEVPKVCCPLCKEMIGASGLTQHLKACEEAQEKKKKEEKEKMLSQKEHLEIMKTYDFLQIRKKQEELANRIDKLTELVKEIPLNILNALGNRIVEKVCGEMAEWFKLYQKDLEKLKNQNGYLVNLCKEMNKSLDQLKKIRIIGAEPR